MASSPVESPRSKSQRILHQRDSLYMIWIKNNYINLHLKFHWKVTGGSKVQNLLENEEDQQINSSNSQQEHSQQEHSTTLFVLSNINCSKYFLHSVWNLFNLWNIWTFGNMKFRKKIKKIRKHHIINKLDHITQDSTVKGKRFHHINDKSVSDVFKFRGNCINNFPDDSFHLNSVQTDPNLGKLIHYHSGGHSTKLDIFYSINYQVWNLFKLNNIMVKGKNTNFNNSNSMIPAKAVPRSGRNSMDNYTSMGISVRNMEIRQCELYNRMDSSNLADPREDARELAEADNIVLADDQLRIDV